jgi:hypothetical protein
MAKKRAQPEQQQAAPEEEEAFPRGGADDLTPLERRKLALQAEADFAQEQDTDGGAGAAKGERWTAKKQRRGGQAVSAVRCGVLVPLVRAVVGLEHGS